LTAEGCKQACHIALDEGVKRLREHYNRIRTMEEDDGDEEDEEADQEDEDEDEDDY